MPLTSDELNKIIKDFRCLNEHPDIPYTKGLVNKNEVIKILKRYTKAEDDKMIEMYKLNDAIETTILNL